jgi:PmbA protein
MTLLGMTGFKHVFDGVLALSTADETHMTLEASDSALTRFARNVIHQNVSEVEATLQVRVVFGKRVGSASTNDLSSEGIARTVERAEMIARLQPANPEWPGLPDPKPVPTVDAFDPVAAWATPEYRARAVLDIFRQAHEHKLAASGAFSTASGELAVANSRGVFAYHPYTDVELTLVLEGESGSGYAHAASWRLDRVDTEALAREAVTRALGSHAPRRIPPGEYPVVLEPYAMLALVEALAQAGMGALAVQEGRSWMNGRIGHVALSPALSIWDDGLDRAGNPVPFDCEGVPKQRVDIVRQGVPTAPVYDTLTAAREPGRVSTGHAQPFEEDWDGPAPGNLALAAGDATVEELIARTECGLYVTRFWYTNLISEHDCAITGTTRDGVWWIEHGELAYPVQNLRFSQRLVAALKDARGFGRELRSVRGLYGVHRLPAMSLGAFRFIG